MLGPLLFIVYINDITEGLSSNIRLFADDTSLYAIIDDPTQSTINMNNDLQRIAELAEKWQVSFNPSKTESIRFSRKLNRPPMPNLIMNDNIINSVVSHKHLGLVLQHDCSWNEHINDIAKKVAPMVNCLRSLKYRLNRKTLEIMYKQFILPIFDYCSHIWDNCTKQQADILEKLNLDALRTVCGAVRGTSHQKIYRETSCHPLYHRRYVHKMTLFYKMVNNITPSYLSNLVPPRVSETVDYNLRDNSKLQSMNCKSVNYARLFLPDSVKLWNSLSAEIRNFPTLLSFKNEILNDTNTHCDFDLNFGSRFCQIIHSRLRLECSDLNAHKYERFISQSPSCSCGHNYEDSLHYFFSCSLYSDIRPTMYFYIKGFDLKSILFGNQNCTSAVNKELLTSIHMFIILTGRFVLK